MRISRAACGTGLHARPRGADRQLRRRLVVDVRGAQVSVSAWLGYHSGATPAPACPRDSACERQRTMLCFWYTDTVSVHAESSPRRDGFAHIARGRTAEVSPRRLRFAPLHATLDRRGMALHSQKDTLHVADSAAITKRRMHSRLEAGEQDARVVAAEAEGVGQRNIHLRNHARAGAA